MKTKLTLLALCLSSWAACIAVATDVSVVKTDGAEAHINTWVSDEILFRYRGRGYSDKQKAVIEKGDVLYTTSTFTHGLYLSCIGGQFRAGIVLKPSDFKKTFKPIKVTGVPVGGKINFIRTWTNLPRYALR